MTFKSTIERVANPRLRSPLANRVQRHRRLPRLRQGQGARDLGHRRARKHAHDQVVATGRRLPRHSRGRLGLRRPPRHARGARDEQHSLRRPLLRGVLHAAPAAGSRRNPNYRGDRPRRLEQIVVSIGVDPRARARAGRGRHGRLRARAAARGGTAPGVGVRPRQRSREGRAPAVLHQRGAGSSNPAHEHEQAALRGRAPAAGGELRDRPAGPGGAGTKGRRDQPLQRGRAHGRLRSAVRPRSRGLPSLSPERPRPRGEQSSSRGTCTPRRSCTRPNLSPWREEAQIVRRNLKPLGIDVQVKEFPLGDFFTRVTRRGEPFDLAVSGTGRTPDPVEILGSSTAARSADHATSRTSTTLRSTGSLHAAAKLSGAKRYRAAGRLALELQRDVVPAAAFATTASRDFFSARIGCQVYQPVWGIDLAALCLRK